MTFHLMTRHPRNEAVDVIDTVMVDGRRDERRRQRGRARPRSARLLDAAIERGLTNIGIALAGPEPRPTALEAMLLADLPR